MACAVELDSTEPYSPGKKVTGKLLCLFNIRETIQGIKCYLTGEERVSFVEKDTYREYKAIETFLTSEIEIKRACTIQGGTYTCPFSFNLPVGIPSSFEHSAGRVVYEVTGEVSRGAGRFYRCSHVIHVSVIVNLNMVHEITMAPVTYPLEEVVQSHCCCFNAHVFLVLSLEKGAFLVGEDIKINLDVKNISTIDIYDVVIKLESHTEVTVEHPLRKKYVTVDEIIRKSEDGVKGNSQKVYTLSLKVPGYLKVYSFRKCKLIRQWFTITAVILFGNCYDQVKLLGYITLGHTSAQEPRPSYLPQPSGVGIGPSIVHNSRNIIPVAQASADSYLPPHQNVKLPIPAVHLLASYTAPSAPPAISSHIRNPRSSAPLAEEDDALLSLEGIEELAPPPTYEEALYNANNAARQK